MKKIQFLLPLLMLIAASVVAKDDRESTPRYQIVKSVADPSLQKDEAVFEFNFSSSGYPAKDSVNMSFNGITKTVKLNGKGVAALKVKPGKYKFQFFYNPDYFEIYTDSVTIKPAYRITMQVNFESALMPQITEKPVIYVYPEKTKQVDIQLQVKGELGFTYPQYNNGWHFTADPDGTIQMNGKQYDYLFWDGKTNVQVAAMNLNEGFLVKKDSLIPFFENQLSKMGLTPREAEDFITYWCPRMNANALNYVHFVFNDDYNAVSTMTINPKPDHLFRVYMIWSAADAANTFQIREQKTASFTRSGFTVVEWGGAEVTDILKRFVTK